jgi:hypothetical protein
MSPRPCVRPGRVASITTAATTTLTQPKRIAPVSVVQRRLVVGRVEDGAADIRVSLTRRRQWGRTLTAEAAERVEHQESGSSCSAISVLKSLGQGQNLTPALRPNVRGAPFSPMKPDGASGP